MKWTQTTSLNQTIINSKQAQHWATTETAIFTKVFRYNEQSSFHLENVFWDEDDAS